MFAGLRYANPTYVSNAESVNYFCGIVKDCENLAKKGFSAIGFLSSDSFSCTAADIETEMYDIGVLNPIFLALQTQFTRFFGPLLALVVDKIFV